MQTGLAPWEFERLEGVEDGEHRRAEQERLQNSPNTRMPRLTSVLTRVYRGYSKSRTRTALGSYGRAMPRSIGLP